MGNADPFRDPRCRIIDELEVAEGGVVAKGPALNAVWSSPAV